eukprot:CAMPEP_0180603908 /NCGR_PEP_ID=MMETSP1037_2-20121125/25764_1 /TAXON_ID=632150 /ORGANISM="Azadinium spinosum, Strain 3D9" /LENGTH=66 /DNA_ID=CAMNT_0022622845 /DNA_START=459 /DNA_END=659 /DNA_ORIENTATION=+
MVDPDPPALQGDPVQEACVGVGVIDMQPYIPGLRDPSAQGSLLRYVRAGNRPDDIGALLGWPTPLL